MDHFELISEYKPSGDQPEAIEALANGVNWGLREQTLLGVTGSGKTFTMASVIAKLNRPTLVLAHNKTLAAQLCSEFREFFPKNVVEYFISYYDYYQPEAYIAHTDTYIEKDASVNEEIDRLRHSATSSLFERRDVIIVASVSCLYGLGDPIDYKSMVISLRVGQERPVDEILKKLTEIRYERNDVDFSRNKFRVRGDTLEVYPAYWSGRAIRVEFFGDEIDRISEINAVSGMVERYVDHVAIYPASHYVASREKLQRAMLEIQKECDEQVVKFRAENKLIEAQRIAQRTAYDLEMMTEIGFCNGIENYSRVIQGRAPGSPPTTLLDYFPKDFLMFIDESHVTLPQCRAMYAGDRSRKDALVNYGFRLPSAYDNRPLNFKEFDEKINQVIYVSATPGEYERTRSGQIVEQVIRPTGLLDPVVEVRPIEGQIDDLIGEINARTAKQERVLVTTLTKKMAEDLTVYLQKAGIKVRYMHSDIGAMERMEIIRDLRLAEARKSRSDPGRTGPAGSEPGCHSGRGQGGLPAQRDQPDPDHGPGGPKRRGQGHYVCRHSDPLHAHRHGRNRPPPGYPGRLQQGPRHCSQDRYQVRPGSDRDFLAYRGAEGTQWCEDDQGGKGKGDRPSGKADEGGGQDDGVRVCRRAPGSDRGDAGERTLKSPHSKNIPRRGKLSLQFAPRMV